MGADSLEHAGAIYERLVELGAIDDWRPFSFFADNEVLAMLAAGLLLSAPFVEDRVRRLLNSSTEGLRYNALALARLALIGVAALLITTKLMAGAYNPFIYFRF